MFNVLMTVAAYLAFNLSIWLSIGKGGIPALAGANILGGLITLAWYYKKEVKNKGYPKFTISFLGALGILLIVAGLRNAHASIPVSLSMESVYNGFACLSWPLFVLLNLRWPKTFSERPNRFDLGCHAAMAILVLTRFLTYGEVGWNFMAVIWVMVAIAGYMMFNISIKLGKAHRATNIAMNLLGGLLVAIMAACVGDFGQWSWTGRYLFGLLLGGLAIFGIVKYLGASYGHFGALKKGSLVAPLVYDGILVASPLVMVITGEWSRISVWTLLVAAGMLAVTTLRYRHHMK